MSSYAFALEDFLEDVVGTENCHQSFYWDGS